MVILTLIRGYVGYKRAGVLRSPYICDTHTAVAVWCNFRECRYFRRSAHMSHKTVQYGTKAAKSLSSSAQERGWCDHVALIN
jgi:hypothetical protein